jgi:Skp family chaperone for outer membrane proteins
VETIAKQHNINLVLDEALILYAAPDLDLTQTLLGHASGAARSGERSAVIALQRVIETTRDGKQARAALKVEFEQKQVELNQRQAELKAKYANNLEAARQSPDAAALVQRYRELQRELQGHEDEAVRAIIGRMKPDIAELARRRGIDVIFEVTNKGEEVVYRGNVAYPSPRGPDLTDELIRLHDERTP